MSDADWMKYKRLRGRDLPANVQLSSGDYGLEKLFKHDFYAATALYRRTRGHGPEQVVFKEYHTDPWGWLPLGWLGRSLLRRETRFLQALNGVQGVPKFLEYGGNNGFAREYAAGKNLREHFEGGGVVAPPEFFPNLQKILASIHALGMAHNDLAKPENILIATNGAPVVIDFQIATMPRHWPLGLGWFAGPLLRILQRFDDYHVCKQYRRYAPDTVPEEIRQRGKRSGGLASFHYHVIRRPYRAVRHFFLRRFLTINPQTEGSDRRRAA